MKTLKIEIPEGFEIDSFDKESGQIKFKPATPKNIIDSIKSFGDVLDYHKIDPNSFWISCTGLTSDEIAYRQIKLLTKALNEEWEPNWVDNNEYKYVPWFDMDGSAGSGFSYYVYVFWFTTSGVGSRLCFKTSELAEYAGKQFTEIYKEFFLIK